MLIFVLCPDPIDRIDILSEQVYNVAKELKESDHGKEIDLLIARLIKESANLNAIFNELCWLESQS